MNAHQGRERPFQADPVDSTSLTGKTFVVKLGGSVLEHQHGVLQDLIQLHILGGHPVLVHGGGPSITRWLKKLHIPTHFERGVRITDAQTLEVVCMVLRGLINQQLVLAAAEMGGKAVGLSGIDGNMIRAHLAGERLGLVGEIDTVDPTLVQALIEEDCIPIIAPLGQGPGGKCLNINADVVAAHLAGALHAEKLIFLSDVTGIYRTDGTLISALSEEEAYQLMAEGIIHGGMISKAAACFNALSAVPWSILSMLASPTHSSVRSAIRRV